MTKRILALYACVLIALTGCGKIKQDVPMVTVWHWMTDRHETFLELAERYEQETGVLVNFQLIFPADIYSQKITSAAQAKILPDIFGILDKKSIVGELIKGGFVADLSDEFEANNGEWRKMFYEKALAVNVFKEGNSFDVPSGIYAVPLDVSTVMMVYNKELLAKANVVEPPTTFEGFLAVAQRLKVLGVTPLVSGWGELWLIECYALNYAINIMGEDKILATYRGEIAYTDPDWIAVFEIFETLAEKGVVPRGIVSKSNKTAEQDFALQRAAFAFNGSWCVNVYEGMMNPKFEYGVMLPPSISDKYPLKVWGAAGSSLFVNESSPHKEEAIAFLKWLSAKEQQVFFAQETKNLPANRFAAVSLPKELEEFGQGMDQSTHPMTWPAEEDPLVREKFRKGLQSIIIGEQTAREVAQEVQELKERQMKRAQRRR